jgi:hypothetical protein
LFWKKHCRRLPERRPRRGQLRLAFDWLVACQGACAVWARVRAYNIADGVSTTFFGHSRNDGRSILAVGSACLTRTACFWPHVSKLGSTLLYSEGLSDGMAYDSVKVINPFIERI